MSVFSKAARAGELPVEREWAYKYDLPVEAACLCLEATCCSLLSGDIA